MKFELTPQEQASLDRAVKQNPIRKYLEAREANNFEIGDVLIKVTKRWSGSGQPDNWVAESISSENKMSQRYVFIYKDEYGLGYMKQLMVSTGKLGKDIYSLSDYDRESTRFEVDPEYAEMIFLDSEFDIKTLHKQSLEARKVISKMNRKTGTKFHTLKEANDFFRTLKVGDTFWYSSDYTAKWITEHVITSMVVHPISTLKTANDYSWRHYHDRHINNPKLGLVNDTEAVKVSYRDASAPAGRGRESYSFDMGGRDLVFYKVKPAQEEKKK